jgi:hypothetical protein
LLFCALVKEFKNSNQIIKIGMTFILFDLDLYLFLRDVGMDSPKVTKLF